MTIQRDTVYHRRSVLISLHNSGQSNINTDYNVPYFEYVAGQLSF